VPRLKKIWADGAYSGKELAKWCEEQGGWELEVVERDKEAPRALRFCQSDGL
jgi:transposase